MAVRAPEQIRSRRSYGKRLAASAVAERTGPLRRRPLRWLRRRLHAQRAPASTHTDRRRNAEVPDVPAPRTADDRSRARAVPRGGGSRSPGSASTSSARLRSDWARDDSSRSPRIENSPPGIPRWVNEGEIEILFRRRDTFAKVYWARIEGENFYAGTMPSDVLPQLKRSVHGSQRGRFRDTRSHGARGRQDSRPENAMGPSRIDS